MFDGSRGDRVLRSIAGRRSPTHTHAGNVKFLEHEEIPDGMGQYIWI